MLPTVRDLARQYELSVGVVTQQMQLLAREGLLYTISGTGTFIGRPHAEEMQLYLLLIAHSHWDRQIIAGFEEEIARRGGATIALPPDKVAQCVEAKTLPPIAGFFSYGARSYDWMLAPLRQSGDTPLHEVNYVDHSSEFEYSDRVIFDNFNGGRQATQHLISVGHQKVAFLGVHAADDTTNTEWSLLRSNGWQAALQAAGQAQKGLMFLPQKVASRGSSQSPQLLIEAAIELLKTSKATAVVTANDIAAQQVIKACHTLRLSPVQCPAIVSFDDTIVDRDHIVTSLRLPWEELGRTAATLLWERANGQLVGSPVCRQLQMRIIPRLTCRANWSLVEGLQLAG